MTYDERFQKFTHGVEEALHEVEEALLDAKEHVLLSVRNHTYVIAFVLMSLTSAILVFGTVYVWCFHHGHVVHNDEQDSTDPQSQEQKTKRSKLRKPKSVKKSTETSEDDGVKMSKQTPVDDGAGVESYQNDGTELRQRVLAGNDSGSDRDSGLDNTGVSNIHDDSAFYEVSHTEVLEQSSPDINKNDSAVKSKIPVRRQSSNKKQL